MEELLVMSKKELERAKIMARLKEGSLNQKQASEILNLSIPQIKRLRRIYRLEGEKGLLSKKRGKSGNHQLPKELKEKALKLIFQNYLDFGPTLAHEKLVEKHNLTISLSAVRSLMVEHHIWIPKRAKKPVIHAMRERRSCLGELVQIDGSPHDWFEGRAPKCTLLVFIDDATSKLLQLWFTPSENLQGYFEASREYFLSYGRPIAFYLDQSGIFRVNQGKNAGIDSTQFARAMQELDIKLIYANSPQAKGRVERANQTLQDRLVKELRLLGISDLETANRYLPTFVEDYNRRFAVIPKTSNDTHRPILPHHNLDRILSQHSTRKLTKNLMIQYNNTLYQIITDRNKRRLAKAKVTVIENFNGKITIEYKGEELVYTEYSKQPYSGEVCDSKRLNDLLNFWKDKKSYKPAKDHPWRRFKIK